MTHFVVLPKMNTHFNVDGPKSCHVFIRALYLSLSAIRRYVFYQVESRILVEIYSRGFPCQCCQKLGRIVGRQFGGSANSACRFSVMQLR